MDTIQKTPEDLLAGIGRSILAKAIVLSIIAHAVLMGATSVSLFKDWQKYGIKSPSAINAIKTEEKRAQDELEKQRKLEAKAAAEAKAEAEQKERIAAENEKKGASKPAEKASAATTGAQQQGGEGAKAEPGAKKPPEIEPLPPKKEFQYGEDLSLD